MAENEPLSGEQMTPEQVAQGMATAQAGVEAAAAEPDEKKKRGAAVAAMRQKEPRLSEEEAGQIADLFIARMEERGAFDPPPERVQAPPPPAPEQAAAAAAAAGAPVEAPHRKTWAERFRGS